MENIKEIHLIVYVNDDMEALAGFLDKDATIVDWDYIDYEADNYSSENYNIAIEELDSLNLDDTAYNYYHSYLREVDNGNHSTYESFEDILNDARKTAKNNNNNEEKNT